MANRRILLVEGNDDEHVLKHICGNHDVGQLDILPLGSVEKLLESLPVRLRASEEGDILGVIVDADTNVEARWQALSNRLKKEGYLDVPQSPPPEGLVLNAPINSLLPRVGIWLMPNNQTNGILEDFLRFLIPQDSPLFAHAENSIRAIPNEERRFTELAAPKALIHTWLAWQKEPGKPLGMAITAQFLDPKVEQVNVLVSWLKRLFFP